MKKFLGFVVVALLSVLGVLVPVAPSQAATGDFVSVWKTDNLSAGSTNSNRIRLPLESAGTYAFSVNWGDSAEIQNFAPGAAINTAAHTYASAGTYTVTISGSIDGFNFHNAGDKLKLVDVTQWGNLRLGNAGGYFEGAANFNPTATDAPSLSGTTNLAHTFRGATSFNANISNWDVSGVTDFSYMFASASSFNQPLASWNMTSATNIEAMFAAATAFSQVVSTWVMPNMTRRLSLFAGAALAAAANPTLTSVAANPTLIDVESARNNNQILEWHGPYEFVGQTTTKIITFKNRSGLAKTLGQMKFIGLTASEFSVENESCLNVPIANNADCAITVNFTPKFEGFRKPELRVQEAGGTAWKKLGSYGDTDGLPAEWDYRLGVQVTGNCARQGFAAGVGTPSEPYVVKTVAQLNCVNQVSPGDTVPLLLSKNFLLGDNLDFNSVEFSFAGIGYNGLPFTGVFDGGNHQISRVKMIGIGGGVFPQLAGATIKNLVLDRPEIVGEEDAAGALATRCGLCHLSKVHVLGGSVSSTLGVAGGMIGMFDGGYGTNPSTITDSSSGAAVTSVGAGFGTSELDSPSAGGLVGTSRYLTAITSSSATGDVAFQGSDGESAVGGLIGRAVYGLTVTDSFATGAVTNNSTVLNSSAGALIGVLGLAAYASAVTKSYATGSVSGSVTRGGLVGRMFTSNQTSFSNNFWDSQTTGQTTDPKEESLKVTPKTSAELKTMTTFSTAGWAIEASPDSTPETATWLIAEGSYPIHPAFVIAADAAAVAQPVDDLVVLASSQSNNSGSSETTTAPIVVPQVGFVASGKTTSLRKTSGIVVAGGGGTGAISYRSLSASVCAVSTAGVITGLASGTCEVEVSKAADAIYGAAVSTVSVSVVSTLEKLTLSPASITAAEIKTIRGSYLKAVKPAVFRQLSVAALKGLTAAQIKVLTKKQLASLSNQQRKALIR